MLGIDFLQPPRPITVAGVEFMDYQDPKCYLELVDIFNKTLVDEVVDEEAHVTFQGGIEALRSIEDIIFNQFGIKVSLHAPSDRTGNVAVDSGWFSPNHVFNNKGLDGVMKPSDTNIGRAFRRLKTDVLRGWVDTSKGRVGGDYSKIEFQMFIGRYIDSFLKTGLLSRYKITMSEALASFILHEVGHIFTSFLFITRNIIDTIMPTIAARMITEGNIYGKERSAIVHQTLSELECTTRPTVEELDRMGGQEIIVMFDKAINTRDQRRTLSLGATDRGAEIYADLFAVRCGVPKALVAALISSDAGDFLKRLSSAAVGVTVLTALAAMPILAGMSAAIGVFSGLLNVHMLLNPNELYDSPYRRVKNLLRDQIIRLNTDKSMDARTKAQMLKDTKELEQMVTEAKPFFEGTAVQRLIGWIFSGSDFKASEFEHYTDELVAHSLSVYKDAF